jgi:chloride channel protein, CIC family
VNRTAVEDETEVPAVSAPPLFFRSLRDFLRVLPGAAQRFWILVIATGALSGAASGGLLIVLGYVQRFAWPPADRFVEAVEASTPLRRVLVPGIAGVLVAVLGLVWRHARGGHGTARIIEAIWHRGRELSLGRTLARGLLSIFSVGMGASLGREGALVQTGAASASWLSTRLRLSQREARVLVACGAASGIAAAYDVPIGGALFGLEVLLGSFALELLGPIVVSCVVATAVARTLPGPHPVGYEIPEYALLDPKELLLSLALAPFLGLASAIYVRVMGWVEVQLERVPRWMVPGLPVLGMVSVGVLAIWYPAILGNGFDTVHLMLLGNVPLELLLLLPLLKLGASAICAGSGVPGGLFTPSLFYGAAIGGAAGELLARALPGFAPPGALALVGMAGVLAGTTHAAVSSVLILFELTGDYDVILPLMLSSAIAAVVSRAIEPDSLYTAPLRRRGVALPELPRPEWLRTTPVAVLVQGDAQRVPPTTPFDALIKKLLSLEPGHDLYVTDGEGTLLGVLRLDALKGTISDQADLGMIVAADVLDRDIEPITTAMTLAEVAARFGGSDLERLPVVDGRRKLVGTVSMRDLLARGTF